MLIIAYFCFRGGFFLTPPLGNPALSLIQDMFVKEGGAYLRLALPGKTFLFLSHFIVSPFGCFEKAPGVLNVTSQHYKMEGIWGSLL